MDSMIRLTRGCSDLSPKGAAKGAIYRDRNVFRTVAGPAHLVPIYHRHRVVSSVVRTVQAEYFDRTGRRINLREARALLAIKRSIAA